MPSVHAFSTRPLFRFPIAFSTLVLAIGLAASLCGCRRDPDLPPALTDEQVGRDYFPFELGYFWVYDVEDHTWDLNVDSIQRYQLRERVDTVYLGASGEKTYRMVRSKRLNALDTWRDDSVFSLVITPQAIRRTANNVPTLELIFPVREGAFWNPNALSARDSIDRTYGPLDQPRTLPNGQAFARTIDVIDSGEDNVYFLREQRSAYARQIGRISRIRRTYDYCQEFDERNVGCTAGAGDFIVRGFERYEYLREYGTHW
jgi:hypothetical protein